MIKRKNSDGTWTTISGTEPSTPAVDNTTIQVNISQQLEVKAVPKAKLPDLGNPNGIASLDANGKLNSNQLPGAVDQIIEVPTFEELPATGAGNKIYVTLDTNKTYRWSGTQYTEVSASLVLGETSATAYRGDKGKTAYEHSQTVTGNPHGVTKSDVGLGNVDNTSDANKPISAATQDALNAKSTVTVSATGTSTEEVQYITINGTEKKLAGGSSGAVWGGITGTMSDQTDLNTALTGKADATHTHTIADVTDLQTTLDDKVPATRTVATIDLADDITVDELFGALKSKFVDMLYPIGARYVQLAGMPEPSTFGGTWSVDSDYNGKTLWCSTSDELGTALTEELPNIKGWESSSALYGANAHLGAIQEQWTQSHRYTESGGTNIGQGGYTFNAALGQVNADGSTYKAEADSTYKNGGIVRPASITCKVWKRTA